MGVSSRTGVISVIYKKDDKKDIANYVHISLLNLDYKIYTSTNILLGENRLAAITIRTILHTLTIIRDSIDL